MSSSSWRFLPKNGVAGGGGAGDGYFDDDGGGGVALEMTVLSADSLRLPPSYSPLPRRLRPYVTVSSSDAPASACSTAVAAGGAPSGEHSWGDTLVVPVGAAFLEGRADVHVSVDSEATCRLVGATPLGWCGIPAADVLDGLRQPRALRRLSYSLRCPRRGGGTWGHGVVHLAVRVLGLRDDDALRRRCSRGGGAAWRWASRCPGRRRRPRPPSSDATVVGRGVAVRRAAAAAQEETATNRGKPVEELVLSVMRPGRDCALFPASRRGIAAGKRKAVR